jgi:outer membrane porin, OprD family
LLSLEFDDTAAGTAIRNPFGGDPTFNSLMISNFNQAHEKSYGIGVTYDFSRLGLTGVRAFGAYAYGSMHAGRWEEEVNATVDYRITAGALRNWWLRLRYAHNVSNAPVPIQDFRVIFNYAIIF